MKRSVCVAVNAVASAGRVHTPLPAGISTRETRISPFCPMAPALMPTVVTLCAIWDSFSEPDNWLVTLSSSRLKVPVARDDTGGIDITWFPVRKASRFTFATGAVAGALLLLPPHAARDAAVHRKIHHITKWSE